MTLEENSLMQIAAYNMFYNSYYFFSNKVKDATKSQKNRPYYITSEKKIILQHFNSLEKCKKNSCNHINIFQKDI